MINYNKLKVVTVSVVVHEEDADRAESNMRAAAVSQVSEGRVIHAACLTPNAKEKSIIKEWNERGGFYRSLEEPCS